MARATRDPRLESRTARSKLSVRQRPYWTPIHKGLYLGYRKGPSGGTWQVRWLTPEKRHQQASLGIADDARDPDGERVLAYFDAQDAARAWAQDREREYAENRQYTVRRAVEDYLRWYQLNRKSASRAEALCNHHILPALGDIPVAQLTTKQVKRWHENLANAPARLRTKGGAETPNERTDNDPRARKATANRILTVLKAALNQAWRNDEVLTDEAWRKVKPFQAVDAPRQQFLTEDQCKRLIKACKADFRPLVRAALFTGARYSELTQLRVRDVDVENATIHIADSKSGRPRDIPLTGAGNDFFSAEVRNRFGEELVFRRPDKTAWGKSHQTRRLSAACRAAGIVPGVTFHGLRHTYGAALARAGTPLQVIAAALGHADTRITERHYAHLLPDYVATTVRANLPDLGGKTTKLAPVTPVRTR